MLKKPMNDRFKITLSERKGAEKIVIGVVDRSILAGKHEFILSDDDLGLVKSFCISTMFLGTWGDFDCEVWELQRDVCFLDGYSTINLRTLLISIDEVQFSIICRAVQLLEWKKSHIYCGVCGNPTEIQGHENTLACIRCSKPYYPRISPCVIVVVTKGDYCLLARQLNWADGLFSAVAGFIEVGESAEDAIHREVFEEVGIHVKKPVYIGSQAWPFPGQLMLGFIAEAASEIITVDGKEISEARWWHCDNMPPSVPPPSVLSGLLIERFLTNAKGKENRKNSDII